MAFGAFAESIGERAELRDAQEEIYVGLEHLDPQWASPAFVDTSLGAIMRLEVDLMKRKRRQFMPEFKADAVKLVRAGGRTIPQVARDFDLTETAVREWVRRAEIEAGEGPPGALSQAEREELVRLRRENRRLQMERDILKKATAFFAKESE